MKKPALQRKVSLQELEVNHLGEYPTKLLGEGVRIYGKYVSY
jgi:hypothetical protein